MNRIFNFFNIILPLLAFYACKSDIEYVDADWARPIYPIDGATVKIDFFKPDDTLNFTWEVRKNASYKIMFDTDMHFDDAIEMEMGTLDSLKIRNEDFLAMLKDLYPEFGSIKRFFWKIEQNSNGKLVSSWRYFDALVSVESFIDKRDNQVYNANQYVMNDGSLMTIMRENLRATEYADGSPLRVATRWGKSDDENYNKLVGGFYPWDVATRITWDEAKSATLSKREVQGICPDGWHLPSLEEYQKLRLYLGQWTAALYAKNPTYWERKDGITNSSALSVVPSGFYWTDWETSITNPYGSGYPVSYFWTSTPYLKGTIYAWGETAADDDKNKASLMSFYPDVDDIYFQGYSVNPAGENRGCPVRCIMNKN